MSIHWTILTSLPCAGMVSRHNARRTSGSVVDCSVVIREAGYQTRVSAKRVQAGCVTERFFATGGLARGTRTHGVHAAGKTTTHRTLGFARAPNSA
jgi:hypothetical protein